MPLKSFYTIFALPAGSFRVKWLLLTSTALVLAVIVASGAFVKAPEDYQAGAVATEDVKAPKTFLVKDTQATEEKRRQAMDNVLTVYDRHGQLAEKLEKRLARSFAFARDALKEHRENSAPDLSEKGRFTAATKDKFQSLLGITVSEGAYDILVKQNFSPRIESLISRILTDILNNGVVGNKEVLLREKEKGVRICYVGTDREKIVYSLRHFYGPDQAQAMVRIIGDPLLKGLDYTVKNLVVDFSQRLLSPNITLNLSETERRRARAAESVKPVLYKINKGEMILQDGERITQLDLLKLKALRSDQSHRDPIVIGLGAFGVVLFVLVVVYLRNSESHRKSSLADNKNLLFFASMLCLALAAAKAAFITAEALSLNAASAAITPEAVYLAVPLASIAMVICLFMDIELTASFVLILAIGIALVFDNSFEIFLYSILNMTMAAYWMQHCRERKVFIKAGVKLGLFNVALALAINCYLAEVSWPKMGLDAGLAFSGGILAGILTAGLAPLIEMVFDYTTDIKLLELSNLDQPLLKRLMIEAPGTYHHSLVVGAMAEAAASAIDANPLLARVCGYYHDIGKIKKPLYFIENQKGGKNKHAKLAPSMSSLILISHVKNGVDIARQYRLGKPVIDAIQQHHGTRLITYFYEKAKYNQKEKGGKRAGREAEINLDDFRYPGPRPQSKEAGLVMLADEIEAAARSLDAPSPSRIQKLMQDLINQTFSEGQLQDCELTLKDLNNIAKSFNTILSGIYHHRIEYPQATNAKKKDGRTDRQSASSSADPVADGTENSPGRLRRLGQS